MIYVWNDRLAKAAKALADDRTPHKYRDSHASLDLDVRSRAVEYTRLAIGTEFTKAQVSYTHCLLQRLDLAYDHPRATHVEFRAAWDEANLDAATEHDGPPDVM